LNRCPDGGSQGFAVVSLALLASFVAVHAFGPSKVVFIETWMSFLLGLSRSDSQL
jgi:hypothetical protein